MIRQCRKVCYYADIRRRWGCREGDRSTEEKERQEELLMVVLGDVVSYLYLISEDSPIVFEDIGRGICS